MALSVGLLLIGRYGGIQECVSAQQEGMNLGRGHGKSHHWVAEGILWGTVLREALLLRVSKQFPQLTWEMVT